MQRHHAPKHPAVPQPPHPPATDDPTGGRDAKPGAPGHEEWLLDESLRETFPASDPISPSSDADHPGRA